MTLGSNICLHQKLALVLESLPNIHCTGARPTGVVVLHHGYRPRPVNEVLWPCEKSTEWHAHYGGKASSNEGGAHQDLFQAPRTKRFQCWAVRS